MQARVNVHPCSPSTAATRTPFLFRVGSSALRQYSAHPLQRMLYLCPSARGPISWRPRTRRAGARARNLRGENRAELAEEFLRNYGTEAAIGRAIAGSGLPRSSLFISTKVCNVGLSSQTFAGTAHNAYVLSLARTTRACENHERLESVNRRVFSNLCAQCLVGIYQSSIKYLLPSAVV